jgi:four helix bundle protein
MNTTFEGLEVFQRAYKISLEIHRKSLQLPKIEQYGLADQIRRASKSIAVNLAEGYGKRKSKAEFKRCIQIALGSADEMRVWVRYLYDLDYIDQQQWQVWKNEYQEIAKMLNGLDKSINV